MKSNKKTKVLMIISILTLLVLVTGATFAYFTAQGETGAQTNINVTTHTTDMLTFATSAPITITADQETFASGKGNREGTTTASATLRANSKTNSATEHYNLYLDITNNTFEYTTDTKTAELILTIKNPEGNVVTSINGLNYVTVGEVSGFDVTEYNNLITIANNKEIVSTGTKIEEWEVKLTLINLDTNQNANTGKAFNASLMIQKEELFAGHIMSLYTTKGANNLYYHNGTITDAEGNIMDAEDNSYRYSGGDYTIAPAHQETYKRITKKATSDIDALLGFMCGTAEALSTACAAETQYFYLTYESTENKTQYATYKEALAKLVADGYVIETPVKNYVCFGSDAEECPYDSLYRIIGVFDGKVKIIKADYATKELLGTDGDFNSAINLNNYNLYGGKHTLVGRYYWNNVNRVAAMQEIKFSNIWSYSELNKTNLNKNFLNSFEDAWKEKIHLSSWSQLATTMAKLKGIYKNEHYNIMTKVNAANHFYEAKIGLMYASDYGYANAAEFWSLSAGQLHISRDFNWMFIGLSDLTLTRYNNIEQVFWVTPVGSVIPIAVAVNTVSLVRPTFYLNSDVEYVNGSGTIDDPFRII